MNDHYRRASAGQGTSRSPPPDSTSIEDVANCARVNHRVIVAEAFPQLHADLKARGFSLMILSMSEFQKIDGGLSCLSLRFKAPARSIPDP
jgi:hypothetical protein